jgi:hypothetical protein
MGYDRSLPLVFRYANGALESIARLTELPIEQIQELESQGRSYDDRKNYRLAGAIGFSCEF